MEGIKKRQIIETVPNFSEGRNLAVIEYITGAFNEKKGVNLLDYSADPDHNRMVITACGEPEAVIAALIDATRRAIERIDLNTHRGEHPRIGAVDVVPFIPIRNISMDETVSFSEEFALEASGLFELPIYLYERAARKPDRAALEKIRKGGFEGLADKMRVPGWKPDFGPICPHPTAGATVVGARAPLIAFNVNLNTGDLSIAQAIARSIRASNGGLPCLKAIGIYLSHKQQAQVSMNLTDHTVTSIHQAFEAVKTEALSFGVSVTDSELIGLIPAKAMADTAAHYLGLPTDAASRLLEIRCD